MAQAVEEQLAKVVSLCFKTLQMFIINLNLYKYLYLLDREDGLHPQEERHLLDQMVSLDYWHILDNNSKKSLKMYEGHE